MASRLILARVFDVADRPPVAPGVAETFPRPRPADAGGEIGDVPQPGRPSRLDRIN